MIRRITMVIRRIMDTLIRLMVVSWSPHGRLMVASWSARANAQDDTITSHILLFVLLLLLYCIYLVSHILFYS